MPKGKKKSRSASAAAADSGLAEPLSVPELYPGQDYFRSNGEVFDVYEPPPSRPLVLVHACMPLWGFLNFDVLLPCETTALMLKMRIAARHGHVLPGDVQLYRGRLGEANRVLSDGELIGTIAGVDMLSWNPKPDAPPPEVTLFYTVEPVESDHPLALARHPGLHGESVFGQTATRNVIETAPLPQRRPTGPTRFLARVTRSAQAQAMLSGNAVLMMAASTALGGAAPLGVAPAGTPAPPGRFLQVGDAAASSPRAITSARSAQSAMLSSARSSTRPA